VRRVHRLSLPSAILHTCVHVGVGFLGKANIRLSRQEFDSSLETRTHHFAKVRTLLRKKVYSELIFNLKYRQHAVPQKLGVCKGANFFYFFQCQKLLVLSKTERTLLSVMGIVELELEDIKYSWKPEQSQLYRRILIVTIFKSHEM
jgi:hypothetical protein